MKKTQPIKTSTDMPRPSGADACRGNVVFDLAFPTIPSPSSKVFALAGEALLCALVERHHERLRQSSIGKLFPADPDRFSAVVDRIAKFIVKAIGGPPQFAESHGHTWLRALHFPITIDETARNVWLAEMLLAFDDVGFPEEVRLEYWNWVEALSIHVINRRTMITQPRRYPFAEASIALRPFMREPG